MKQGLLVIISSPGGGGKDAVLNELLKKFSSSVKMVTTTSRKKTRPTDIEGQTYYFISREDFENKIKENYFIEHNDCVGNYYGTPRKYVQDLLDSHKLVFAVLDVNGKHSFDRAGINNLSIFLLPDSMETLRIRARNRGGMTEKMIDDRIKLGEEEIEKSKDYDFRIVNAEGKLEETVAELAKIIRQHQFLATLDKATKVG